MALIDLPGLCVCHGSMVAGRKRDPGQEEKRMQGPGSGLGLNSSQGTVGPACLGTREQTHSALLAGVTAALSQRDGTSPVFMKEPRELSYKTDPRCTTGRCLGVPGQFGASPDATLSGLVFDGLQKTVPGLPRHLWLFLSHSSPAGTLQAPLRGFSHARKAENKWIHTAQASGEDSSQLW